MKTYLMVLLLTCSSQYSFAQKKLIHSNAYKNWPVFEGQPLVSNDGLFVFYSISTGMAGNRKKKQIIQSTQIDKKIEIQIEISNLKAFTADSRNFIFLTPKDSLCLVDLNHWTIKYIPNVSEFSIPSNGSGEWLFYKTVDKEKKIFLRNLKTGVENNYDGGVFGQISDDGNFFVYQEESSIGTKKDQKLRWVNLKNGKLIYLWEGDSLEEVVVDFNNKQLAFKSNNCIWHYKIGQKSAKSIASVNEFNSHNKLKIGALKTFSKKGDRLFISLEEHKSNHSTSDNDSPEIWSYSDINLQSAQEIEPSVTKSSSLATIRLKDYKVIKLQEHPSEYFQLLNYDDYFLCSSPSNKNVNSHEATWNSSSSENVYNLINGQTGKRQPLTFLTSEICGARIGNASLSPTGHHIVYYDFNNNDYICYDTSSGNFRNLTKGIQTSWRHPTGRSTLSLRGIAGWLSDDAKVLIYDSHDIWKFDLLGMEVPENVTNYYGKKHNIIFTLALSSQPEKIDKEKRLIFSALNLTTKDNGFFNKKIGEPGDPIKLSMGPYLYKINSNNVHYSFDFTPIKARDRELYIVKRQSAVEAPNYFLTNDFKFYKQLSDQSPQKNYNWYRTELHTWKSLDGRDLQGILYKPENFDPRKKYPVIFYYYEKLSDGLNSFLNPGLSEGRIDIPTYVSNGYLIFCPDIYYKIGDPMQGTYDAVISAAKYVSKMSFVNPRKLGLQGHSFGAVQTNYLVTHSNLFAAACSASGRADWISGYGTLNSDTGESLMDSYENGQSRMGGSLWANIEGYIKSSPVLSSNKITTPLLLMHTKLDNTACAYTNVMEFFLGLRRLGKKAWMVVYNKSNHTLDDIEESKDFTLRMQQFFDHYLKDKPAPLWMLNGVDAKDRAYLAGTELDTTGRTPGNGLLNFEQQKEVDSLMTRMPVMIELK